MENGILMDPSLPIHPFEKGARRDPFSITMRARRPIAGARADVLVLELH